MTTQDESHLCNKYGCDFQVDLDGQVTCCLCGARDDDMIVADKSIEKDKSND